MTRPVLCVTLFAVLLLGLAVPGDAEVFTVKMKNGNWFQSRYQPETAGWAEDYLMLLTEVGNWIAIRTDEIEDITSETENRGFGIVLNTTTIVLGYAPNDAPTEEEAGDVDPREALLRLMEQRTRPQPAYSVQQFAEPSNTEGIPIWMTGTTTPPLGGAGPSGPRTMSGAEPRQ